MVPAVLLTLALAAQAGDPAPPGPVVVRGVTVVDARAGELRPGLTVVVDGPRVAAVGPAGEVAVPDGARVLDGAGRFLIPGLWDMHVHAVGAPRFPELFLANGVTGVRDLFTMGDVEGLRADFLAGTPDGPRLVAAGRIVDGENPFWPGSIEARTPDEGRAAVGTLIDDGADLVKVYSKLSRETYFAIAAEARERGVPFDGHVPSAVRAAEASEAGQRCIEHLTGVLAGCSSAEDRLVGGDAADRPRTERLTLALETYDPEKAAALFATFAANGTWHCPTLTVLRSIAHLDDPSFAEDERLAYLPSMWAGMWDPQNDRRFRTYGAEDWAAARAAYAKNLELVGALHAAGVRLVAGTDCANPYCFPGFSLHDELGLLVEAGLTPAEALRTATWNPAEMLGRTAELGSVEAGKLADLVLLDANPLEAIGNTRAIAAVVAHGRLYDADDLAAMLGD